MSWAEWAGTGVLVIFCMCCLALLAIHYGSEIE